MVEAGWFQRLRLEDIDSSGVVSLIVEGWLASYYLHEACWNEMGRAFSQRFHRS